MQLTFDVNAQTLSRTDKNNPATDSVDYLTVKFNFVSPEWDGISKIALFSAGDVVKKTTINASGECEVPWEVLVKDTATHGRVYGDSNRFYVSVVGIDGTVKIPTVTVRVDLGASGYAEGTESGDPTPDLYAQYVADVKGYADTAVNAIKEIENIKSEINDDLDNNLEEIRGIESGIKDSYANAFKGEASGEVIRVDDVSPVEHTVNGKVKGKNLLNPIGESKTENGITFTNNGDGTFTVTGTSTSSLAINLTDTINYPIILEKGKTYTQSVEILEGEGATSHVVPSVVDDYGKIEYNYFNGNQTKTADKNYKINSYAFYIASNVTLEFTFRVQLEEGDVATEYTPYIDPTTVKLTRCGKNLLPYPFTDGTVTRKGVTFTDNGDGTLTVNGTAEATTSFVFFYGALHLKGKYTLSGMSGGSGSTYYIQPLGDKTYPGLTDGSKVYEFDGSLVNRLQLTIVSGAVLSNVKISLMLEKGEIATEYERYNGSSVTPSADISVDITSLSPTMTLFTDTAGVTIDIEYNRDTTAVMGDLKACLDEVKAIHQTTLDLLGGATNG